MSSRADLRSYYQREAELRLRRPLEGPRVELRDDFLGLLESEGRRSVLDLGAGPASDGQAFVQAGHYVVGVDLAHGNGLLAAELGLNVIQASIAAPPFRPQSFDAGWSMSTLMHVPEADVVETLAAMTLPLRPGAPLLVGLWGGEHRDVVDESKIEGERRVFFGRPLALNQELLATCGSIEQVSVWDVGPDDEEYQVFLVRIDG